jgi:hypothetical protein
MKPEEVLEIRAVGEVLSADRNAPSVVSKRAVPGPFLGTR